MVHCTSHLLALLDMVNIFFQSLVLTLKVVHSNVYLLYDVTPRIQSIYSIEFRCFILLFKLFNLFNYLFDDNMWYLGLGVIIILIELLK